MTYQELKTELIKIGVEVNDKQIDELQTYLSFLLEYNKNVNLTAIRDEEEAIEKHLFDSILPSTSYDFNNKNIIDVGSGAGFPGIPLAIIFKNSKFTLLEPIAKKAKFLSLVVEKLNLKNVEVLVKRSEDLKDRKESYDIAISRAVARLNILLEIIMHLLKVNGVFIAMKSQLVDEEVAEAKVAFRELHSSILINIKNELPFSHEMRSNIVIKKDSTTPNKYPRPYAKIIKRPL